MTDTPHDGQLAFSNEPVSEDESRLVGMLFNAATKLFPEWNMGDRTDLAMSMFSVVKQWAHADEMTKGEEWEVPSRLVIRADDRPSIDVDELTE